MPYVEQYKRPELDEVVDFMIMNGVRPDGSINYVLFKLCKKTIVPSYMNYRDFIAELNEAAAEIRRRFLVPHEDRKIIENGDVD
jgi:hypothetical protein